MNTQTPSAGQPSLQLQIAGMTCASCVRRVEKSLAAVPGVTQAVVNLATEQATVQAAPALRAEALVAAVGKAGYEVVTSEATLQVEGMTCASCVARVEKALLKVPGVVAATVNLATERATVLMLSTVPTGELLAAVEKAGYAAHGLSDAPPAAAARLPAWWPVLLSALLTLPLVAPMLLQPFGLSLIHI